MGLMNRNGRTYYLRSVRKGGRVTSECHTSGPWAAEVYEFDRNLRLKERCERSLARVEQLEGVERRREQRRWLREFREALAANAGIVDRYFAEVGRSIDLALAHAGYRRHARGPWRRRRDTKAMSTEVARLNVAELARLAKVGDRIAAEELWGKAPAWFRETAAAGDGYLDETVEELTIRRFGPNAGPLQRDAVAARMAIMREELAPSGSGPILELLATRAAICWLHIQILETDLIHIEDGECSPDYLKWAEAIERRLARAQSRYVQALTAIARVKRLALPVLFQQLNVGTNQQINNNPGTS